MDLLFVYNTIGALGGTETLMARMGNWLVEHGHRVQMLVGAAGTMRRLTSPTVEVMALSQPGRLVWSTRTRAELRALGVRRPDVIKSFDWASGLISACLAQHFVPRARHLAGNYLPVNLATRKISSRWVWQVYKRLFLMTVAPQARLIPTPQMERDLRDEFGDHGKGRSWPIPVDTMRFSHVAHAPRKGNIVSIGRLGPMKEYNLYMVDVVERLVKEGWDVTWQVYGSGPFEAVMRRAVAARGLDDRVSFMGVIPYEALEEALSRAYVFVGMGTAAIEAAASRVPVIVAQAHDAKGITYGPLYCHEFGNTGGEPQVGTLRTVASEIRRVLTMNEDEYQHECTRNWQAALRYDMESRMELFVQLAANAPVPDNPPASTRLWVVAIGRLKHMKRRFLNTPLAGPRAAESGGSPKAVPLADRRDAHDAAGRASRRQGDSGCGRGRAD
jgi:glycosyltransferase involved in cell wall biosynthesis